ncbi:hypothetical protein IscW_ISCW015646, partial [Ixodes scapularis]
MHPMQKLSDRINLHRRHKTDFLESEEPPIFFYQISTEYRPFQRQSRTKRFTARVPGFESVCQCCPTALGC